MEVIILLKSDQILWAQLWELISRAISMNKKVNYGANKRIEEDETEDKWMKKVKYNIKNMFYIDLN